MAVTAQGSGTKQATYGTVTVTIASPAVFTFTAHGLAVGDMVTFSTTGALPTGLVAGTVYYVISVTTNTFQVSATPGGAAVNTSGSQSGTHTITSEHVLLDVAVAGAFQLIVDKSAMAAGDTVELRVYQIVLTGGTRRVVFGPAGGSVGASYTGAQPADDQIAVSDWIGNELTDAGSVRFTLKQTAGTSRAFPWKVLKSA